MKYTSASKWEDRGEWAECSGRPMRLRIAGTALMGVSEGRAVSAWDPVTDTRPLGTGPFLRLSLSGPGLSPARPLSDLLLRLNSRTVSEMLFPAPGKENQGHKRFLRVFLMWNLTARPIFYIHPTAQEQKGFSPHFPSFSLCLWDDHQSYGQPGLRAVPSWKRGVASGGFQLRTGAPICCMTVSPQSRGFCESRAGFMGFRTVAHRRGWEAGGWHWPQSR